MGASLTLSRTFLGVVSILGPREGPREALPHNLWLLWMDVLLRRGSSQD